MIMSFNGVDWVRVACLCAVTAVFSVSSVQAASIDPALSLSAGVTIHHSVSNAETNAQTLLSRIPPGMDRWHLVRAVQFLNSAATAGSSVEDVRYCFSQAHEAVQAIELVRENRADVLRIETDLAGGICIAVFDFIDGVERDMSRQSDTKFREDLRSRIKQARQDYDCGLTSVAARDFARALRHWRRVFERIYLTDPFRNADIGRSSSETVVVSHDTTSVLVWWNEPAERRNVERESQIEESLRSAGYRIFIAYDQTDYDRLMREQTILSVVIVGHQGRALYNLPNKGVSGPVLFDYDVITVDRVVAHIKSMILDSL